MGKLVCLACLPPAHYLCYWNARQQCLYLLTGVLGYQLGYHLLTTSRPGTNRHPTNWGVSVVCSAKQIIILYRSPALIISHLYMVLTPLLILHYVVNFNALPPSERPKKN